MKLRIVCVAVGFLSLALSLAAQTVSNSPASAQVPPPLIQFSNVATDEGGNSMSGVVSLTFSLYSSQQGGEPLWTETQNNIQLDSTGHYSVQLGITTPNGVPTTLFTTGEARWLGVKIAEQAEQPRILLLSVPYALKAGDAATIGGLPPSAFVLAPQNGAASAATASATRQSVSPETASDVTTTGGKAGYLPVFNGASTVIDSKIYQKAGNVGIGNTAPKYGLDVGGHINSSAGYLIGDVTVLSEPGGSTTGNFASGPYALPSSTTGSGNTATGYEALLNNSSGSNNTAIGANALLGSTGVCLSTGNDNTATGFQALSSNCSGSDNTGTGSNALIGNTYGIDNTATGSHALYNIFEGNNNTATGYQALYSNDTSNNTANGYQALYNNSANNNTATGSRRSTATPLGPTTMPTDTTRSTATPQAVSTRPPVMKPCKTIPQPPTPPPAPMH